MHFSLIPATEADLPFLLDLRLTTMDAHLNNAGLSLTRQQHQDRVLFHYHLSHIIWCGDHKVGLLKIAESQALVEVLQFQILPEFQGKGYGRCVMDSVIDRAGNRPITLRVLKSNPASRLYYSLGFEQVGEDNHEYHLQYER